jgi:hypothetical protein
MSRGVVYIASLSHSGSTLLDLLLGNHPRLVGLGEISKVLDYDAQAVEENLHMACTCGARAGDCAFWGKFLTQLKWLDGNSRQAKYEALLDYFYKQYDEGTQIVDSSKYQKGLENVRALANVQLRVIHLIKDVRSFCTSHRRSTLPEIAISRLPKILNSEGLSDWVYSRTIKSPSYLFWKWYLRNQAMLRFLEKEQISFTSHSYDQLATQPEMQMNRIFDYLNVDALNSDQLIPADTGSHIFLGNPVIGDPQRMQSVRYDDRWQQSTDWKLASEMFGAIMDFNNLKVYANTDQSGT